VKVSDAQTLDSQAPVTVAALPPWVNAMVQSLVVVEDAPLLVVLAVVSDSVVPSNVYVHEDDVHTLTLFCARSTPHVPFELKNHCSAPPLALDVDHSPTMADPDPLDDEHAHSPRATGSHEKRRETMTRKCTSQPGVKESAGRRGRGVDGCARRCTRTLTHGL
jgi:hypothetical protein